ncbi:MAG: SUMF1/EgtB/PvdO family nonheme iron enzyme, partial [Actinomycetota bacterium]|nr:SUMF1/EgtB/PvdO family nonheme iron enzyme [Actinomycetota bacterium]
MGADPLVRLVDLPGGRFRMGTDDPDRYPGDGEGPVRDVELAPFSISATAVTTAEFAAFVDAAGHVTTAEEEGWSFVFG